MLTEKFFWNQVSDSDHSDNDLGYKSKPDEFEFPLPSDRTYDPPGSMQIIQQQEQQIEIPRNIPEQDFS